MRWDLASPWPSEEAVMRAKGYDPDLVPAFLAAVAYSEAQALMSDCEMRRIVAVRRLTAHEVLERLGTDGPRPVAVSFSQRQYLRQNRGSSEISSPPAPDDDSR
jgi:hypothetical protein